MSVEVKDHLILSWLVLTDGGMRIPRIESAAQTMRVGLSACNVVQTVQTFQDVEIDEYG